MDRFRWTNTGFTLVELMVTVAVIAVILVIGVPNIANMKRSGDLTTASNGLAAALNYARAEAVRRGTNVIVVSGIDPVNDSTNTNFSSANGWQVRLSDPPATPPVIGPLIRNFDNPPASSTIALTTGSAPITFAGLGNVSALSCFDISVAGSSVVRSIDIALAGRVSTNKTACP